MRVPVYKPSIRRKDMDSVLSCLVSDRLEHGLISETFIQETSKYLGLLGGIGLRDPERAMDTSLAVLELASGDSVALSPLAPYYVLSALKNKGLNPVWIDVIQDSCVMNLDLLESRKAEFKAIIVDHTLGYLPDLVRIAALEIPFIEIASRSIGADVGEKKAGSFGTVTVINLDSDDLVTAGSGTLVLSGHKKIISMLKKTQEAMGVGLLMSDMNAALGLTQLHELPKFLERREELYEFYLRASMKSHHKILHQVVEGKPPLFSFAILPEKGIKEIIAYVKKYNVETAMAFERSAMEKAEELSSLCPNAYSLSLRCMLLPFYPSLSSSVVNSILKVLSTLP